MRVFTKFLDPKIFESKIEHLKNIDCSIFIDYIPQNQNEISNINILVLAEPNGYFGLSDWAIKNKNLFAFILTWDDRVLNNCENSIYLAFGHTWLKPEQYKQPKIKEFNVAHLCGVLNKTYGHSLRHEVMARQNEFKMYINFHQTIGNRHDLEDARKGKEIVFGNSKFGIAIENFSHRGFFTEKILDCFLMRTIPIYWGCSNIGDYFNIDGILRVENVDDIIYKTNMLKFNHFDFYKIHEPHIEENYQKALQYVDYEGNIIKKITEIFKHNNLI